MSAHPAMKRDGLWLFLLLTFGWTWGIGAVYAIFPDALVSVFGPPSGSNPVFLVAVSAPTVISLLVAGLVSGRTGLSDLIARLVHWRVAWAWYALATLGVVALALGARALSAAVSDSTFLTAVGTWHWSGLIGAALATWVTDPGPMC